MKKFVIALSVISTATLFGLGAAQAQTVVVTDGEMHHHDHHWHHGHCMVKTVETHHHGHLVTRQTRICH
jgi:Spy/CpxP family protein refolding chaperone